MKPMKTAAALRASDTEFLQQDSMGKLIEEITRPVMDEQDEIDMLKATIKAKSAAILKLKREASRFLETIDHITTERFRIGEDKQTREALRKALSEIN